MDNRSYIINENIGLVHACAQKFKGRGIEYDDIFQAGCVGLIKAVDALKMLVLQYSLYIFQNIQAVALALFGSFDEVRTASCGKKNNKIFFSFETITILCLRKLYL